MCFERRLDFKPGTGIVETDDGVIDGCGFASCCDESARGITGHSTDFETMTIQFLDFGPEEIAGEMVFEGGVGDV